MTRTWAVGTAFARVQLRFKRFPSLHTLLLCIAARAFALPVEVDSSHWPNAALHLPFTHCIHRQVVAAHRPPPPPAAARDFRFCSGRGSVLLPQLSTFLCCSSAWRSRRRRHPFLPLKLLP